MTQSTICRTEYSQLRERSRCLFSLPIPTDDTAAGFEGRIPGSDDIVESFKTTLIGLEGSRVANLLEDYRLRYGRLARERAFQTYHRWRGGSAVDTDESTLRLLDLMPRHLSRSEKLELIQRLRLNMLERLQPVTVNLTIAHGSDLTDVVTRVLPLLRRLGDIEIPNDARRLHGWLNWLEMPVLAEIARSADGLLAAQRLADLVVSLSTLFRLRALASPHVVIHVQARFEIPTATIVIEFRNSFWKENIMANGADDDFLLRLQDMALAQERQAGTMGYVEFVMRTLTAEEQEKLRTIAVAEGLRTEILLRELQVKTLAARADIEMTIATAQTLQAQQQDSKIVSEHATASGMTRIEIIHQSCPLLAPLKRLRK